MYADVRKLVALDKITEDFPYLIICIGTNEVDIYNAHNKQPGTFPDSRNTKELFVFCQHKNNQTLIDKSFDPNKWYEIFPSEQEMEDFLEIKKKINRHLKNGNNQIFNATLSYLLIKLNWLKISSDLRIRSGGLKSEKALKLISAMKVNHTEQRSIKHYSKEINVAENYLGELCQNELSISFRNLSTLLMLVRILDSFYLTEHNFSEISFQLGFTDQAHFNNFFKKHMNMTPSEFRQGVMI